MKRLLNRVMPNQGESLYSILFRTAKANYFEHLGIMFKERTSLVYAKNCNYIKNGQIETPLLEEMTSMLDLDIHKYTLNQFDSSLVNSMEYGSEKKKELHTHRVYQKYGTKYCPICIQEEFFHKLEWDIALITTCQRHRTLLVDACPRCQKKVLLSRFMNNHCKCGFQYSDTKAELEKNPLVIQSQDAICKYLFGNKADFKKTAEEYFFIFFHMCFLIDKINIEDLTSFKSISLSENQLSLFFHKDVNKTRYITAVAHAVTSQPEVYFQEILRTRDNIKSQNIIQRTNMYLKEIFNSQYGSPYQEVYNNYLIGRKDVYANEMALFQGEIDTKKYLTRAETAKLLNRKWDSMKHLCDYGLLVLHKTNIGNRVIYLIEKESVEKYIKMKKESMTLNQLADYLDVHYHIVTRLVDRGFIQAQHGPKKDGFPIWYFNCSEVEQFLSKLILKAKKKINAPDRYWISFESANRRLRPFGVDTVDLFKIIQEGTLSYAMLKNEQTIKGICVCAYELEEYINLKQKEIIEQYGFRIDQIAKVFKVRKTKIRNWIEEGKLKVTFEDTNWCGTTSKYISIDETIKALMEIKGWSYSESVEYVNLFINE